MTRTRALIGALALAATLALTPSAEAAGYPHAGEVGSPDTSKLVGRHQAVRPATYVVGDSIVNSVYSLGLHAARPGWEISSVPGRDVSNMPWYVWDRLASRRVPLRTFVWALGTNADPAWGWAKFRQTVNRFPATTRIVFVTVWRDPAKWSKRVVKDYRRQSEPLAQYNKWMRLMDRKRPHTCVFDWAKVVSARPQYLHDGVHPTKYGAKIYSNGVSRVGGGPCR